MQLSVKTLTGKLIEITDIDEKINTVNDIKQQIFEKEGISIEQQRLVYAGKQLENGKVLSDYKIQPKSILHLLTSRSSLSLSGDSAPSKQHYESFHDENDDSDGNDGDYNDADDIKIRSSRPTDKYLNCGIGCLAIVLCGWIIFEIASLSMASAQNNDDCNDINKHNYNTSPSAVLITGSIITMFYITLRVWVFICRTDITKDNAIMKVIDRIFYVFIFAWCILGFIVYNSMNSDCKQASLGQTLAAWSVLHFMFSICCGGLVFYLET